MYFELGQTSLKPTHNYIHQIHKKTRLPNVIWERLCYAANSLLVKMGHPTFPPQNYPPSHGLIPKPNYLPHLWTHPTYYLKLHAYPISHFATMH